ncbi:MAG TPA: hypothetical protein VLV78_12485 [Thermoanaerobaculia bacterium]|nr:hypothetical protein [Thermoanaerobaculia bacterium]
MDRGAPLLPTTPKRHRVYGGLTERQERIFTWVATAIIVLFIAGWIGSIVETRRIERAETHRAVPAPPPAPRIATTILEPGAPKAAYINDAMLAFLAPLRGESGNVRFTTQPPGKPIVGQTPNGARAVLTQGRSAPVSSTFTAPSNPGVYNLAVQIDQATRAISDFSVITLVPFSEKHSGRIGLYYLGNWPYERGGKPRASSYANPVGFIKVTPDNADTPVSAHFRLRDFLTRDQPNVWPKYLLLNPKLIDKLELTIQELEAAGHPVRHLTIMSGFRTPNYNYTGGITAGRANLSRHMYGDASDVFVDNDGNGSEDDLNHDGRVDTRDAQVVSDAADRVERKYPSLAGGIGVYSACCGHGPFTHIDVRGFRARWRGTGNG